MTKDKKSIEDLGEDLKKFINSSPTPHHVVDTVSDRLRLAGFKELIEDRGAWGVTLGKGYFVIRGSSIIAWVQGGNLLDFGMHLIVAHTDSPNLRLKPKPVFSNKGYMQFAVEPYGGLLLNSWLNRDLGVAGKIIYRDDKNKLREKLIDMKLGCSIPQLAIHLDPKVNDGLTLNKQKHLSPIITIEDSNCDFEDALYSCVDANCKILAADLQLYDLQKAAFGGYDGQFIYSARLDNLASCHAGVDALIKRLKTQASVCHTAMLALFDHEEVGNQSSSGADSSFLADVVEMISLSYTTLSGAGRYPNSAVMSKSFCISADMAHALHPNYADQHEPHHRPLMGGGPVIKSNSNQRYATNLRSRATIVNLLDQNEIPYQDFVARSDMGCGSTVGPVVSSRLGISTIDIGSPMLSMHSIREQAHLDDHYYLNLLFEKFFCSDDLATP